MSHRVSSVVVKIAERCNLNCTYCYMYNHVDQTYRRRPAFMSRTVFSQVIRRMSEYLAARPSERMSLIFHGGEPMLMPPATFGDMLTEANSRLGDAVDFGLQTNATLVTREWIAVLKEHRVKVSVSMDGPPEVHDKWRVYRNGRGSYEAVVAGVRAMQDAGLAPTVLAVVQIGADGLHIYRHFRSLGFRRFGFKFPEACYETPGMARPSLRPAPIADYLVPIFDEWYQEDDPGVHIALFTAIIRAIYGRPSHDEGIGGNPNDFLVIETDGEIHLSDGLRACEDGLSDSGLNIDRHGLDDLDKGSALMRRLAVDGLGLPTACAACPEAQVCGGGKASHRYSRERGFDNPSVWCADLLRLISHIRAVVAQLEDQPARPYSPSRVVTA